MSETRVKVARFTRWLLGRPPPPPPGWRIDPGNPSRSIHEPRSGTGTTSVIRHLGTGGGGTIYMPPGPGGTGGTHVVINMPPCPVCGRPVPATGEDCDHGGPPS